MLNSKRIFSIYILFFLILSLFFHKDVIFNIYNYGRHWDWTFYPLSDYYNNYLHSFLYSIKINSLGYVDILSINLAELLLKFFIFTIFQIFIHIPGMTVSIPIINKLTVFVLIPMISSLGMWFLGKKILAEEYKNRPWFFLLITAFANIVYTFSLILIFDLHGGALNRELGSAFFPWFFLLLYQYNQTSFHSYIDYRIVLLGLSTIFFDISNIFYAGILVTVAILLKKMPTLARIIHFLIFALIIVCVNTYWLQGLFIGHAIDTSALVQERKLDYNILANYSVPYRDIFSVLNTPHNLAIRTFGTNPLVYVPFISMYIIMCLLLIKNTIFQRHKRLSLFLILIFIITTVLVTGVYGLGGVYTVLYSFEFLGFIRSSVRYMPNLAITTVFMFLIIAKIGYHQIKTLAQRHYVVIIIPFILWFSFLLFNGRMISLVNENVVKDATYNHEIGALYQYKTQAYEQMKYDKLLYNVVPAPSWFSPLFVDNVYPKTSQGSDTDNVFTNKGQIVTFGSSFFAPLNFEMFLNSHVKPIYLSLLNVRGVWFKNQIPITDLSKDLFFNDEWIFDTLGKDNNISQAAKKHLLYKTQLSTFLPRVYVPDTIVTSDRPLIYLPDLINTYADHARTSFFMTVQNKLKMTQTGEATDILENPPVVEFKQIDPTKYRIRIHNAPEKFPLIVSIPYHPDWNLYKSPEYTYQINKTVLPSYRILDGNSDTQASSEELNSYVSEGYVSDLGDGNDKNITHTIYINGMEKIDFEEKYNVDYISKNINGTIQNDNLPNVGLFEPWYGNYKRVEAKDHLMANGYANAWIIHTSGETDLEYILAFDSQKNYSTGLIVSISVIMLSLIFSVYQYIRKNFKHEKHN